MGAVRGAKAATEYRMGAVRGAKAATEYPVVLARRAQGGRYRAVQEATAAAVS